MSIQRLKYNVQDKMDSRPREKSSSYTVQDESTHYKNKYIFMYVGTLRPAELSMLIRFCIFKFDNQMSKRLLPYKYKYKY